MSAKTQAQKAYNRYKQAQANQKKKKVVNTQTQQQQKTNRAVTNRATGNYSSFKGVNPGRTSEGSVQTTTSKRYTQEEAPARRNQQELQRQRREHQTQTSGQRMSSEGQSRFSNLTKGAAEQYVGSMRKGISQFMAGVAENRAKGDTYGGTQAHRNNTQQYMTRREDRLSPEQLKKKEAGIQKSKTTSHALDVAAEKYTKEESKAASAQIARGNEKIEKGKEGLGAIGRFGADAYVGGLQLGMDMLSGAAFKIPGAAGRLTKFSRMDDLATTGYNVSELLDDDDSKFVGRGAMLFPMALRSFGGGVDEAEQAGASWERQMLHGGLTAGIELGTEKMFNMGKALNFAFGRGYGDDLLKRVVAKIGNKNINNVGAETAAMVLSETLEEMVAEGLEPIEANLVYGNATGDVQTSLLNDPKQALLNIGRAGGLGAVLSGPFAGANIGMLHYQGKKISENAQNIYGEDGIKEMARQARESEDEGDAAFAQAVYNAINEGKGVANIQVAKLQGVLNSQKKRDAERTVDAYNAAEREIANNNYSTPRQAANAKASESVEVARRAIAENIPADVEMSEAETNRIVTTAARIGSGIAGESDIREALSSAESITVMEAVTGLDLGGKSKTEQHDMLIQYAANQYIDTAKRQTEYDNSTLKNAYKTIKEKDLGVGGQAAFDTIFEEEDVRGLADGQTDFRGEDINDVHNKMYTFEAFYRAGTADMTLDEIRQKDNPVFASLTPQQQEDAYIAGRNDALAEQNAAYLKDVQVGRKSKKAGTKVRPGHVTLARLSDENKQILTQSRPLFEALAKALGIEIEFRDEITNVNGEVIEEGVNGHYQDGKITISMDNDKADMSKVPLAAIAYVFEHEVTHHMKVFAPAEFFRFKQFVKNKMMTMDSSDGNFANRYEEEIAKKRRQYGNEDVDLLFEEILADATIEFIQDEEFCKEICEQDADTAHAIIKAIRNLMDKIREIMANIVLTDSQRQTLFSELDILKDAEQMWLDGIRVAAERRNAVGETETETRHSIKESLDRDLQDVLDNTFPANISEVEIGETSQYLTDVIGAQKLTLLMPPNKAYAAMVTEEQAKADGRYNSRLNYHGLGKTKLISVLEAAEDPVISIVSKDTEDGQVRKDRIMLVTDEVDEHGNPIVVIEQVSTKGLLKGNRVDANRTVTVYDKGYIQGVIQDAVAEDRVLSYDKKRISTYARSEDVQFVNSKSSAYFNKNIDDFWANVNYEKYMGRLSRKYTPEEQQEHRDMLLGECREFYGAATTEDYKESGYILPDGRMPKMGDMGIRGEDHIMAGTAYDDLWGSSAQNQFISEGNIRFTPEILGFEMSQEPTEEQYDRIRKIIDDVYADPTLNMVADGIRIDFTDDDGRVLDIQVFNGTSAEGIIGSIKAHFAGGTVTPMRQFLSRKDSEGRYLSERQMEYFKDSKARDAYGHLIPVYHSSDAEFTVFDEDRRGESTGSLNTAYGFFTSPNERFSKYFGKNTRKMYANITTPIIHPSNCHLKYPGREDDITRTWFETVDPEQIPFLEEIVDSGDYDSLYDAYMGAFMWEAFDYAEDEREIVENAGYDGIEVIEGEDWRMTGDPFAISSFVVFNSNQLKDVDNLDPTDNADIRLSRKEDVRGNTTRPATVSEAELIETFETYKDDEVNRAIAIDALNALLDIKPKGMPGVTTIAHGISEQFIHKGYVDFRGQTVRSVHDLAEITQVLRDPRFETFRVFFMKGDEVVAVDNVTSRLPGMSAVHTMDTDEQWYEYVREKMDDLESDGYYILHNHPSGVVNPSDPDINVTNKLANNVMGFRGHVILDHNKFAFLGINGDYTEEELRGQMTMDLSKTPSVDHPLLGVQLKSKDHVAMAAKSLPGSDDVTHVVFVDSMLKIREIQDIANGVVLYGGVGEDGFVSFGEYLRDEMVRSGSMGAFFATKDEDVQKKAMKLIEQRFLVDSLLFDENNEYESAHGNGARGGNDYEFAGIKHGQVEERTIKYSRKNKPIDEDEVSDIMASDPTIVDTMYGWGMSTPEGQNLHEQTKDELIAKIEKLKQDMTITDGKILDEKSVREEMNKLVVNMGIEEDRWTGQMLGEVRMNKTNRGLVEDLVQTAKTIWKELQNGNHEAAVISAMNVSEHVVDNLLLTEDTMYKEYKELVDYLKNTKWELNPIYHGDFADGFVEFKKEYRGKIRIVKSGGRSPDELWGEMCELWPEFFTEDITNPAEMMKRMAEVRDSLDPYSVMLSEENQQLILRDAAADIIEIVSNGKPLETWADKRENYYREKIAKLKARQQEAIRDIKEKQNWKDAEKKLAAQMAEGKRKAQQQRAKQESKEKKADDKGKRQTIAKISKQLDWLSGRLLKPSDDKHLPEGYRNVVAQMLAAIDPQTERSKALEEKYGVSKKRFKWLQLRNEYERIASGESYGFILDDQIMADMQELSDVLGDGDFALANMTYDELQKVYRIVRSIRHGIQMQNKMFSDELKGRAEDYGRNAIETAETYIDKHGTDRKGVSGKIQGSGMPLLDEGMLTPRDYFEYIGGGLNEAFLAMRRGQDEQIKKINYMRSFFESIFRDYGKTTRVRHRAKPGSELEAWRDGKNTKSFQCEGGTIELTPSQVMSLYCLMKREQAQGHILGSGIKAAVVNKKNLLLGENLKEFFTGKGDKKTRGRRVSVTAEDIMNIVGSLTEEQRDIADKMQTLMSTVMSDWGNEASMKMFGYRKFTEENYFPIECESTYLATDFDVRQTAERVKNPNFAKSTQKGANNPVVIDDIFSVCADHCNRMAMYSSYAPAIADFQRVYNFVDRDPETGLQNGSVKESLQAAYGDRALKYIERFMTDLNGTTPTTHDDLNRFVAKSLANYKKAAIGGNLRVAVQQPTAMIRALLYISPKYFIGKMSPVKEIREMKEHCPIALWKSWGFSQVDMARDLEDIMMNQEWSRFDMLTMEIYNFLDLVTWGQIWRAVKNEVKAEHKDVEVGSDEFYRLCNERASYIFDKSQVVDSVFHKSQVMRNTDVMSKMLTSFMAEPTRTFNMVGSEIQRAAKMWQDGDKSGAMKVYTKAFNVFILNAATVSMAAAVVDMMRGKGGDDDDDDDKLSLMMQNFIENMKSNALPHTFIPLVGDVVELFTDSWGAKNMSLEGYEKLAKSVKDMFDEDKTWAEKIKGLVENGGYVFGIPSKNIMRELQTALDILGIEVHAAEESDEVEDVKLTDKFFGMFKGEEKKSEKKSGKKEKDEEEEEELEDYIDTTNKHGLIDKALRKMDFEEGGAIDNFLDKHGLTMTDKEARERAFDKKVEDVVAKGEGKTGEEKDKAIWKATTEKYTKYLDQGDMDTIKEMREVYKRAGGDEKYFDEKILGKMKSSYKKTIGDFDKLSEQEDMKNYMLDKGMTEEEISSEIVYKSDTAKKFAIAAQEGKDSQAIACLVSLYMAGMTDADAQKLWENRWRYGNGKNKAGHGTGQFSWPCSGRISSYFGRRNSPTRGASSNHPAIDIAVPSGTTVCAADGGVVIYVGHNGGYGNSVGIDHGNGFVTYYNHLSSYNVQKGQMIRKGQPVALSGSTGVSTGPHLDFKVMKDGTPVDPMKYLN